MFKLMQSSMLIVCVTLIAANATDPDISFSGYLDADVWSNMKGDYFTNSELDLGMSLKFSEKLSANVYATVNSAYADPSGPIPAGGGAPDGRWLDMAFDGFDITYTSSIGTVSIGDLVYQYGKFNYYLYKRLSMITAESFTRGLKYSFGSEIITQDITVGVADLNSSTADIQGATTIKFDESGSLGIYYGIKNNARLAFSEGSDVYAGAEYTGAFGNLSMKADLGYMGIAKAASNGKDRGSVISILLEPTLSLGNFSVAFTGFMMIDGNEEVNSAEMFGLLDEMFVYVEPGYSFSDMFAFGLPLEYHAIDVSNDNDDQLWAVPTLYVTFNDNAQWWIWGQVVTYLSEDEIANDYALGSEIIVTF